MYTSQCLPVRWGNVMCEKVGARNGVKEGGVISPILFAIDMDELLIRLKKSSAGCHIELAYSVDVTLIYPTLKSLNVLIKMCAELAKECNDAFNCTKTKLLVVKGRECTLPNDKSVCVNSQRVVCEVEADHLGHRISSEDKEGNVKAVICGFWRYYNLFIAVFWSLLWFHEM